MKKQLLIIGGGFTSFWSAVSSIRQSLEMLLINSVTEKNNKTSNFLTPFNNNLERNNSGLSVHPINNDLAHKDGHLALEDKHVSLAYYKDWIDEDTSQGGEFLDDALRIKDQSWGLQNKH